MSENRTFFEDTVARILADTMDKSAIDAAEERRELPKRLFDTLLENGIMLLLVPEELGGIGASIGDAAAIMRHAGRAAAPGPLLETIVGNHLLAKAGLEPAPGLLSLVFVDGSSALPPCPEGFPSESSAVAWQAASLHDVPWAQAVDQILVVARTSDGAVLIITKASDWDTTPGADAAGEPCDSVASADIAATVARLPDFDEALRTAAVLRSAQILGAVEWSFQRSVEYAGERKQFGRELSKFQAIQQMLAELAGHVLATAGLTEAAAESPTPGLVAAVRSRLGDASDATITIAHQVHGALGFSVEYALNARTRRLMAWRDCYGSVPYWRSSLAKDFASLSRDDLWPAVTNAAPPAAVGS